MNLYHLAQSQSYKMCFCPSVFFGSYYLLIRKVNGFSRQKTFYFSYVGGVNSWTNKLQYKDTKTKCRHLKKLTSKGTLRQVLLQFIDGIYSQPVGIFDLAL
jgi:hypothetical protein